MALARRSGLDGLAAMRPQWREGGIRLFRPFLDIGRDELRAYLRRHGLGWRDDPSNENPRFQRVRARRALAGLGPVGITATGLSQTIRHINETLALIEAETLRAFQRIGHESAGSVLLDRAGFTALEPGIARRLLLAVLGWISAGAGPTTDAPRPRGHALARLRDSIALGRDATLCGCRIRLAPDEIRFLREPRALSGLVCAPGELWDGKWRLVPLPGQEATAPAALPASAEIRALGEAGLRLCPAWRDSGLRRDQLLVTPALWSAGCLIAAPLAGRPGGWQAKIDFDPARFILSH
jgi:tRNA(Ile)-lysidine synthase